MLEAMWLDPRDACDADRRPIIDAVNIPFAQLAETGSKYLAHLNVKDISIYSCNCKMYVLI